MINLYIDTNAYLTFYHLTSDDLEELKKLQVLIQKKVQKIILHLPEQTFDEFNRNREIKIADALKRFREEKLNNQFPQISKEYPEYLKMREAIKEFDKNKSKLLEKLNHAIFERDLAADQIIQNLFDNALIHNINGRLLSTARTRYDLGRPPGKNNSYGDAINWETLLTSVPDGEDLYFVSDDKDFYSEINSEYFSGYLIDEWQQKKKSTIYSYRRISEFFKDKFPEIKIASEYEKEILIKELATRGSFAGARASLIKLSGFDDFSTEQLNDFVSICLNNNQVYWIKDDSDIKEMISNIVTPNRKRINASLLSQFDEKYQYKNK